MHLVLAALNAKFIHSSLAVACLSRVCRQPHRSITTREYTINQNPDDIMADLYGLHPDVLGFSCYIWNIEEVLRICIDYKKVAPGCLIILGGPEVSFAADQLLKDHPEIDVVVHGEGEAVLPDIITALEQDLPYDQIQGITCREDGIIKSNLPTSSLMDLDQLPRPAYEDLQPLSGRTVYYETSRGCTFNCSFCLSSVIKDIRYRSLDKVKEDLKFLLDQGVGEVKFVDRTFNSDEVRARNIMEYILEQGGKIPFHFEIRAELMSDSFIKFLRQVPSGKFNFEIGVQSTCPETLRAVNRPPDWNRARINIARLREETKIHIHLDLIAGLPYENYQRFRISFNDVYSLGPHMLQLGFLKMLKGTKLAESAEDYGCIVQDHPPYQVLANDYISFEEMIMLTRIEELLNRYYNSFAFSRILAYINTVIFPGDPFGFFESFSQYWLEQGWFNREHRREKGYAYLRDFIAGKYFSNLAVAEQLIKVDYLVNLGPHRMTHDLPAVGSDTNNETLYALLKNYDFIIKYLPEMEALKPGERRRRVHLEYVRVDPESFKEAEESVPVLFVYPPGGRKASRVIQLDIKGC